MSKRLLSTADAARRLGLDPRTIYERVRHGELPAIRVGRVWRFEPAALDEWVARCTRGPEPEPEPIMAPAVVPTEWTDLPIPDRILGALLSEQRQTNRLLVRLL